MLDPTQFSASNLHAVLTALGVPPEVVNAAVAASQVRLY